MHAALRTLLLATLVAAVSGIASPEATADAPHVSAFRYRPAATTAAMTDRVIVKLRAGWTVPYAPLAASHVSTLSAHAGTPLAAYRTLDDRTYVLKIGRAADVADVRALADRLATHDSVEYAEPDRRHFPAAVPTDPYYQGSQWYLYDTHVGLALPAAWNVTTGSASVTVAVLDTGILPHADLPLPNGAANWNCPSAGVCNGYDLVGPDSYNGVSYFYTAADGDGYDGNPTDPGNYVDATRYAQFTSIGAAAACPNPNAAPYNAAPYNGVVPSDWHGTSVASIIGARTNNGVGIAGVAWTVNLLPVRVLGTCGGYDSDIAMGIRWAAGLTVAGASFNNPHPAKVINMSLGGTGPCSQTTQSAIDAAIAAGTAAIVTAAGNDGAAAANDSPGNCSGVVNVAAVTQTGNLATYSNSGTGVTVSAPGGAGNNSLACQFNVANDWILTAADQGTTTALHDNSYVCLAGTSAAAPLVSGVAALMVSANPNLTATQVSNILKATARAFPSGSTCNTTKCGYGLVDAAAAVTAAVGNPNLTPNGGTTPASGSGGGSGGGGGGCAAGRPDVTDPTLPALLALAVTALARRRRAPAGNS
jgi:serine protease